ncbi:AGAP005862-PA-like protein [Anopheles sinensis]|uniref:AGAP005862-PA-like protein n=1 Tax=Anopheles sinensis TaxID=74873 RepID=A0A084WEB3_ANOSI|nr:AGAP005862-PA-like protein [Anopheles sinensis]
MAEEEHIEAPQAVAHRIIHYFYESKAIGRDAWNLSFWEEFSLKNRDIGMDAKALRAFFFTDIMHCADHLDGVPYEVLQCINPLFNRIRADVLEDHDIVEGTDYVFDREGIPSTSAPTGAISLLPVQLKTTESGSIPSKTKQCDKTPTVEQILRHVSDGLSELLWTKEEKSSRPKLTTAVCLQRTRLLQQNHIPLVKFVEPGMSCYERYRQMGLVDPLENESNHSGEYQQRFQTPQGMSTPLGTQVGGDASGSTKGSAVGHSSRDEMQASCNYRLPNIAPNYNAVLKYVRSKPRKFKK